MGTGLNCTKTKLHEGTKLHECTKLHEDDFAPRVNLHELHFCTGVKIYRKKIYIYIEKKLNINLIKQKEKKVTDRG